MKAKIKIITAMLMFGSMGLFVRNIELPASTIALARGIIGVLFLTIVSLAFNQSTLRNTIGKNGLLLFIAGIALSANWVFLFEAYKHTTIATATLSYYLAPVIVVALSPLVLKEKITAVKFCSVAASLVGMVLVSGALTSPWQSIDDFIGIGYGIAAAISYASITLLNKFTKEISSTDATIAQLGVASVFLLPYTLMTKNLVNVNFEVHAVILLIILGVIHTGLGFWLYFSSIQELKAQTVAAFSYIDPVTALLLSTLILDEKMGFMQILGAILILGSTLICERFRETPIEKNHGII